MVDWWDIAGSFFARSGAEVYPGTVMLPRTAAVTLRCVPQSPVYPSARLSMRELTPSAAWTVNRLLRPAADGGFVFTCDSPAVSFVYSFTVGNTVTGPDTIRIAPLPALYSLRVTLHPPAYTRRPVQVLPEGQGAISAWAGTRARFSVGSNLPLRAVSWVHARGDTVRFGILEGKGSGEVQLTRPGSYTFILEDSLGQRSDSLPGYFVTILPDYPPDVRIVKPGADAMLAPAQQETLWVEAADDFGFSGLFLSWYVSKDPDTVASLDILGAVAGENVIRRSVAWDLTGLSLYPGDTVFYWAQCRDSRSPAQESYSDTFFFRVPDFSEIHDLISGREDDAERALTGVQKLQKEMGNRLESLMRSTRGKESLSWEEKKIVEDIGNTLREQADSLDKAVQSLEDAVQKMKESSVSGEILKKMDEVQKALHELLEQYGDSVLFDKPRPDESLNWRDMQKAIEKMTGMLPEMRERLDNALKYLQMLKKEGERALFARRAQELAERQMETARMCESQQGDLKEQGAIADAARDLVGDIERSLTENSPVDLAAVPSLGQVDSMQKSFEASVARQRMPQRGAMSAMSAALQSLSGELEATLSSAMEERMEQDQQVLLGMAQDALHLARWQGEVARSARNDADTRMSAAEQQALKDALLTSMKKIDSLQMVPPHLLQGIAGSFAAARDAMEQALQSLGENLPGMGMKQSEAGLTALAAALLGAAENMQQGGGGEGGDGMMSGLRRLSGKQAAINSATAELLRQMMMQSGGSESGSSGMGRDAKQARDAAQRAQQQLADQLRELGEKYGDTGGSGMAKRVKELEEEARRIAQALANPAPEVSERQERFLVRMLQNTLSVHKQDEGKEERKSRAAVTVFSESGSARVFTGADHTDTFYTLRMKALDGNFPDSYRETVRKYFDALGELYLREKR
jgi:hypothetical protein